MQQDLKQSIETLCNALREDKSEGSYYYAWQSNIAMNIIDEFNRDGSIDESSIPFSKIHELANNAAKNFLDLLIKQ